ncbi:MAG TPA: universal stress protein, partial [Pyrinomonadaceae bacterium]|nr:universal stress protein [Pyrinomonadaceae bacterium]
LPVAELAKGIMSEAQKGYDMLFLGIAHALDGSKDGLQAEVGKIIEAFKGATALAIARGTQTGEQLTQTLNILVPATGTDYSRRAAEVAITLAKASGATVTALHIAPPPEETDLLRRPRELLRTGRALLRDIGALGKREGVTVRSLIKVRRSPEAAILRQVRRGRHNLLVLGVKVRQGEQLFFGRRIAVLLERASCSLLIVNS